MTVSIKPGLEVPTESGSFECLESAKHRVPKGLQYQDRCRRDKKPLQVPEKKVLQLGNYMHAQSREHTCIKGLRGSKPI